MNINQVAGIAGLTAGAVKTIGTLGSTVNSIASNGIGAIAPALLRAANIPAGAETFLSGATSLASFSSSEGHDWRVRLSMPSVASYSASPVLQPLLTTNGLIFPYTPQITVTHKANYNSLDVVHNNYPFAAYQGSSVEAITITGDFYVEDASEAAYWIAAVHYLRSMTKMLYGDTTNTGAPPPVVKLSGYGQYVLNNIPVVITDVQTSLPNDVDYIACPDPSGALGSSLGGLTGLKNSITNAVTGAFKGVTGSGSSVTYVPIKSQITVTCKVLYSREQVRKFSLDKFVSGSYVLPEGGVGLI